MKTPGKKQGAPFINIFNGFGDVWNNPKYGSAVFVVVLFLATRVATWYLGHVSYQLIKPLNERNYVWKYTKNEAIDIWSVWDSGYYIGIARNGYSPHISTRPETLNQAGYAFYPLYPITTALVAKVVANYPLAGFLVSNLTFLVASLLLFYMLKNEFNEKIAKNSLLLLYAFPTAFIFTSVYSESLFLMLSVASFYFSRKEKYVFSGLSGGLASLTRGVGLVLLVPLLIELWDKRITTRLKVINSLKLALIPAGTFAYMLYVKYLTGDLFASVKIEAGWGRKINNPINYLIDGFTSDLYQHRFTALITLFILVLLMFSIAYLRNSYWIYALFLILIPLSTALTSMPRYVLVVFPLFILLGLFKTKYKTAGEILVLVFALAQGIMLVFWTSGMDLLM